MNMGRIIRRGDIYYADLDPAVGSEQAGSRPILIIQNNIGNLHGPTVIVTALTHHADQKTQLPTHCVLKGVRGLKFESVVLGEQIRTLDKRRLTEFVGRLNRKTMRKVDHVIKVSLGLIEDKRNNEMILSLCPTCAGFFYDSPDYYIKRTDMNQYAKETCDYCQSRRGFTFSIVNKQKY